MAFTNVLKDVVSPIRHDMTDINAGSLAPEHPVCSSQRAPIQAPQLATWQDILTGAATCALAPHACIQGGGVQPGMR